MSHVRSLAARRRPALRNVNEYFENERLCLEHGGTTPRETFRLALREYAATTGSSRQAWLLEAVIRAARALADQPGNITQQEQAIVQSIADRYRVFAPDLPALPPQSLADVHAVFKRIFF